jgi:transcriptional regulator with XRE-family HTH domain
MTRGRYISPSFPGAQRSVANANAFPDFVDFSPEGEAFNNSARFHDDNNVSKRHLLSIGFCVDTKRDKNRPSFQTHPMAGKRKKQLTGFEKSIIQRTRHARNAVDINQIKIAETMGIPRATYANYETDRVMDIELMPKFCKITGISIEFLLTGKEHPLVEAYINAAPDDRRLAEKVLAVQWEFPKKTGT